MENQLETFEKIWDSFLNSVKGALIAESEKEPLTFSRAKMILDRESVNWQNDFTTSGRWLSDLQKSDEKKGKEIRRILTEDMCFTEEKTPSKIKSPKFIGAVGGGALGYGIASAAELGTIATAITTLVPMAACYIGGNIYANQRNLNSFNNIIAAYCSQLDKFKHSVIAILNA